MNQDGSNGIGANGENNIVRGFISWGASKPCHRVGYDAHKMVLGLSQLPQKKDPWSTVAIKLGLKTNSNTYNK